MAAGELLELLESLPRGAVEASIRLMRGYTSTGKWPEPILTSPDPQRGRSPSPQDEWSDARWIDSAPESEGYGGEHKHRTPSVALVPPSAYPMRERSPVPCAQPSALRAAMRPAPPLSLLVLQNPAGPRPGSRRKVTLKASMIGRCAGGRVCPRVARPSPSLGCPIYLLGAKTYESKNSARSKCSKLPITQTYILNTKAFCSVWGWLGRLQSGTAAMLLQGLHHVVAVGGVRPIRLPIRRRRRLLLPREQAAP